MTRSRDDIRIQRGHGHETDERSREQGFEARDAPTRPIAIAMLSFGALMLLGLAIPVLLLDIGGRPDVRRLDAIHPPAPRLLADPRGQRLRLDVEGQRALSGIDQTMRDVAQRGWKEGGKP